MLHDGDRAGENDIGVDETAELHGVELSAELQPEALPADHARHAEQRQRQEVERVVAAQNARGNGRYIIHGEVGLRVGEIARSNLIVRPLSIRTIITLSSNAVTIPSIPL